MGLNLVDSTISNWNTKGAATGVSTTSTTTDVATPTVTTKTESNATTTKPAKNLKGIIAVAGISIVTLGVAFVAFKKIRK